MKQRLAPFVNKLLTRLEKAALAPVEKTAPALRRRKLVHAKNVSWGKLEQGTLNLSRGELLIYPKRKLHELWRKRTPALRIQNILITSAVLDTDRLTIMGTDQAEEDFEHVITFEDEKKAVIVAEALGDILEELGIDLQQAQRDDEERREKEEKERQAELASIKTERLLVWRTSRQIWETVTELRQMIELLRSEDWDLIESSWRRATEWGSNGVLNLSAELQTFLPVIESKSADDVYRNVLSFFRSLGVSVGTTASDRYPQDQVAMKYDAYPRWSHVPYFYLFTLVYTEIMLIYNIGTSRAVTEGISTLELLSGLLRHAYGIDLQSNIGVLGAALQTADPNQLHKAGQRLEVSMRQAIEKNLEAGQ